MATVLLDSALESLAAADINIGDLFLHVVNTPQSIAFTQISASLQKLLSAIFNCPSWSAESFSAGHHLMKARYTQAVTELTNKDHGWHFQALRATPERLRDSKMEDTAKKMQRNSPELWELIGLMLGDPDPVASFDVSCGTMVFCDFLTRCYSDSDVFVFPHKMMRKWMRMSVHFGWHLMA